MERMGNQITKGVQDKVKSSSYYLQTLMPRLSFIRREENEKEKKKKKRHNMVGDKNRAATEVLSFIVFGTNSLV